MKLYNAAMPAPNPRRVRMFLAEKGPAAVAAVELVDVAIMKREHKAPEHIARNAAGQVPTLELDDGAHISETVSICRYLESVYPEPALFGKGAKDEALVDMWTRRIELQVGVPAGWYWRHAHPFTAQVVVPQYKDFGESNKEHYARALMWMDGQLTGQFVAGKDYTIADICLLTIIDFADWIGLKVPDGATKLRAWHARVSERPSAKA